MQLDYYFVNLVFDCIFLVIEKHYSIPLMLRNCSLHNLRYYRYVSFKGEKSLCPIFLSSSNNNNKSKSRPGRRWGSFFFIWKIYTFLVVEKEENQLAFFFWHLYDPYFCDLYRVHNILQLYNHIIFHIMGLL